MVAAGSCGAGLRPRTGMSVGRPDRSNGECCSRLAKACGSQNSTFATIIGPKCLLQSGQGWYTEPYHRFDVGFIERTRPASSES